MKIHVGPSMHILLRCITVAFLVIFNIGILFTQTVLASTPLSKVGYLDFSYGTTGTIEPTAEKPESKLWWNDGFWWASLYNGSAGQYHIYRLNWGTQSWEDTGVVLDDRPTSRADTFWDSSANKLYVASHVFSLLGSKVIQSVNWGRLYRYSYNEATQTYALDNGFPVTVNQDKTETMVLDKDSVGRLWVTYVSRNPSVNPNDAQVFINQTTTAGNDTVWGTPLSLGDLFPSAHVSTDDIASIISFNNQIGVLWSNQIDGNFYFAYHDDNQAFNVGWTLQTLSGSANSFIANDHIHLAKDSAGDIFAAIKTSAMQGTGSQTWLFSREATTGEFSFHPLSAANNDDTRPIVVVDDSQNKVNIFKTSRAIGGVICYQDAAIVHPVSNITITPDNCRTSAPLSGAGLKLFISDDQYTNINNSTSTKQNVNATTGLVVLASDNTNGQVYVHNVIGDPPPVVTHRSPDFNATNVDVSTIVLATFSKDMDPSTLTGSSFSLSGSGGPVSGSVAYDAATRTVSFTPTAPLQAGTTYTATLTNSAKDTKGLALFGAPETWQFTTSLPTVQFNQAAYSVMENGGNAVITATLNHSSSQTVTVNYATSDGTAHSPGDYTAKSGTLTFTPGQVSQSFQVAIINNAAQDGNRTVNLTLSNPNHATLDVQATALLTIIDDDSVLVGFNPGSFEVDEGVGSATITVNLSKSTSQTASVHYATSDGTAQAPGDYTAVSGTITFNPGETTKSFQVPITNDSLFEDNETIHLTLSAPSSNVQLGVPNDTAILTITNNDPIPQVMFNSASYAVAENAGNATITVVLSAPSGLTTQVNYQTANITAIAGVDFTNTSGTLTFTPGSTSQTFNIPIADDTLNEPQKTLDLILSSPSNAVLGSPNEAILAINDNDPPPTIQFNPDLVGGSEASGSVTLNVTLNTASGQSVSIDYITSDGTATAGKDYKETSGTLVFLPGETSHTIKVNLIKDKISEPQETFFVTLSNPIKGVLSAQNKATVLIDDGSKSYIPLVKK